MNPDLDLALDRIIRAPRAGRVARVDRSRPASSAGGCPRRRAAASSGSTSAPAARFVTAHERRRRPSSCPHLDACFLAVDELERIVFTNAIDSALAPGDARAGVDDRRDHLRDHPDGTDYRVLVRHGDPARPRPARAARLRSTAGAPSPSSSPRWSRARSPMKLTLIAVRHPRRRQPGTGLARRGHQRRLHPRRLAGAPHGPDVHRRSRRLARPRRRPAARPAHLRGVRARLAADHRPRRPVHRADERPAEVRRVHHDQRRPSGTRRPCSAATRSRPSAN